MVATLVDIVSVLFAYALGVSRYDFFVGLLYACFDAWIVVWMRKPISRFIHSIISLFRKDESKRWHYL